jgi:NAD(P)-dependent dehydrogenase (short-subunit alcohol dehydrogenase family)
VKEEKLVRRVAVITGASAGMGLVAAKALASQGWHIIATGRDPQHCTVAQAEIRAVAQPGVPVEMIRGDLALMAEAVRLAKEIAAKTDRIDVLINNAGGAAKEKAITAEGNEETFASNHLGHFVMTRHLLPLVRATAARSAPGATRILNMSSSAHETAPGLNFDDLQMMENFIPIKAYCNAKLANIYFTRVLARHLAGSGIVVHAMHPGAVNTNFVDRADAGTQAYLRNIKLLTPEQGADTLIWLVTAPEAGDTSGNYYTERNAVPASAAANDPVAAERLWAESEKLAAGFLN